MRPIPLSADPSFDDPDWPRGHDRIILPEVDSTNAEAARRAATLHAPTWIMAIRQTSGRGRRGRVWHDPGGNFAATLVMHPPEPAGDVALRSFVAALALHDALTALTGRPEALSLKWPNDVLLNGGKLSGILLETGPNGFLALGIGVNLVSAPPGGDDAAFAPVSLLGETGLRVLPEQLLDALAPAFAGWEARLTSQGFAPVRAAFLARAVRVGQPVAARTVTETREGIFETIDETGALVLATAAGRVAIPAADIYFP